MPLSIMVWSCHYLQEMIYVRPNKREYIVWDIPQFKTTLTIHSFYCIPDIGLIIMWCTIDIDVYTLLGQSFPDKSSLHCFFRETPLLNLNNHHCTLLLSANKYMYLAKACLINSPPSVYQQPRQPNNFHDISTIISNTSLFFRHRWNSLPKVETNTYCYCWVQLKKVSYHLIIGTFYSVCLHHCCVIISTACVVCDEDRRW